ERFKEVMGIEDDEETDHMGDIWEQGWVFERVPKEGPFEYWQAWHEGLESAQIREGHTDFSTDEERLHVVHRRFLVEGYEGQVIDGDDHDAWLELPGVGLREFCEVM